MISRPSATSPAKLVIQCAGVLIVARTGHAPEDQSAPGGRSAVHQIAPFSSIVPTPLLGAAGTSEGIMQISMTSASKHRGTALGARRDRT